MNARALVGLALALALPLTALACASADPEPTHTSQKTASTSPAPTAHPSASSTASSDAPCVPPGTHGNALGIGAYCDAKTRCSGDAFCTADFGAPVGAQFCTFACSEDKECGEGAVCYKGDSRGAGCVPAACVKK
jgi:hypothetical protein